MKSPLLNRLTLEGLYFAALARGYLRHRNPRRRRAGGIRRAFYEQTWREGAAGAGASWRPLGSGICEITLGEARTRVLDNMTALDDPVTLAVLHNKPLTHRILRAEGLSVPRHAVFSLKDVSPALAFLGQQTAGGQPADCGPADGAPGDCVVKPANGTGGGAGVATGIRTPWQLARAAAAAAVYSDELMIEEQVEGDSYRLLYLDGELIDAYRRGRPTVLGDGKSTVARLVHQANEQRLREGAAASQGQITFDLDMRRTLAGQGWSLRSVPPAGTRVTVKTADNENRGDDNTAAAHLFCRSIVEDGRRAVRALGARFAGIDLLTPDPTVPLAESGGVILEVNGTPNLYFHYHRRGAAAVPAAARVLEKLLRPAGEARQELDCEAHTQEVSHA